MRATLAEAGLQRTTVLVFETGDEAIDLLTRYVRDHRITAAHFSGIGAFSEAELGFFDWTRKDYARTRILEQMEVLSLSGDIALKEGRPAVHAHVVVGKSDSSAHGGHLMSGIVRPTLEIVLVPTRAELRRETDPETGLALIRPRDGRTGIRARKSGRNGRG